MVFPGNRSPDIGRSTGQRYECTFRRLSTTGSDSASRIEFGHSAPERTEHPAGNRRVIDSQPSLGHDLFQIPIAERIPQVETYAQDDALGSAMTSSEQFRSARAHPLHPTRSSADRVCDTAAAGDSGEERRRIGPAILTSRAATFPRAESQEHLLYPHAEIPPFSISDSLSSASSFMMGPRRLAL